MIDDKDRDSGGSLFTRRFDRRVWTALLVVVFSGVVGTSLTLWAAWQTNIRVGYEPTQPIAYSHTLHAGSIEIDCRYCHTGVESTPHATLPSLSICMNCHSVFKGDPKKPGQIDKIRVLLDHWDKKTPVVWEHVYDLADFAYFDHSRHIQAGLDCHSCHGAIEAMAVVKKVEPLTMGWCVECHMGRTKPVYTDEALADGTAKQVAHDPIYGDILAPINCSTCHR
jgi:hypothetical protein